LQVPMSYLVEKRRPLPTMITGIILASFFPLIVSISNDPWLFVTGLVIFSIGEITAYPKLISYVGLIAPKDKVAIYMGFLFLPVYFSALFFDYPNGLLWQNLVVEKGLISEYWYIITGLGGLTVVCLFVFHLFVGQKLTLSKDIQKED